MHIPDGFLAPPVWAGLAAISAPGIGLLARQARRSLDESRVPLMGVMGAFLFAAQMINFPVGAGTSGHLLGSTLLAVTLGTAPAAIVMTAILAIQALVFQDGGLLALGANVFNMALVGVFAGGATARLLPGRLGPLAGGLISVMATGCLCLLELRLSGVPTPRPALWLGLAVFAITGLIEGLITAAVLGALERLNPRWTQAPAAQGRRALAALTAAAALLGIAGFLLASSLPDGLERVAGLLGLEGKEAVTLAAPMAEYQWHGLPEGLGKSLAGVAGLALAAALALAAGKGLTRWRAR